MTYVKPEVYETKLAFRRLTPEGWVPGLPRRKLKSEYPDYGDDETILSILLSAIDAMKAPFVNRRNSNRLILTCMPVYGEVGNLIKWLGPSLWPGEQGRTPAFIDPTFKLDFSNGKDREQY
jgi:hypothetical protein